MSSLPRATVVRLPRYLRLLEDVEGRRETVSSNDLADSAGVNAANVRRDLSHLDFNGIRGVGYPVSMLKDRIRRELGIAARKAVAIVGAGNLGRALANYGGLSKRGFDVVAIYDNDSKKVGQTVGKIAVRHIDQLAEDRVESGLAMAILAVPARAAQTVADRLVEGGISSLLNFAPIPVLVPKNVTVRQVDLSMELQVLSYYDRDN